MHRPVVLSALIILACGCTTTPTLPDELVFRPAGMKKPMDLKGIRRLAIMEFRNYTENKEAPARVEGLLAEELRKSGRYSRMTLKLKVWSMSAIGSFTIWAARMGGGDPAGNARLRAALGIISASMCGMSCRARLAADLASYKTSRSPMSNSTGILRLANSLSLNTGRKGTRERRPIALTIRCSASRLLD